MPSNDTPTELTAQQCWRLLGSAPFGRLATIEPTANLDEARPAIVPVNFLIREGAIFFRSAPGGTMMAVAGHRLVAFEVDGHRGRRNWSVIVHGNAHRLSADADIEASGIQRLRPFHGGDKQNFVRIDAESITGRSFLRPHEDRIRPLLRRLGSTLRHSVGRPAKS